MDTVEPIRDKGKIKAMKRFLASNQEGSRDVLLLTLGINSALRISDLLKLKISDVFEFKDSQNPREQILQNMIPRERISLIRELREKKTGKEKLIRINESVKMALAKYRDAYPDAESNDFVFKSKKGANRPIGRVQAWRLLNAAAVAVGIKDNIGTHSLRKTWGYHAYNAGYDLTLIQQALNHASPRETLRYIGITQDQIDNVTINLNL